MLEDNIKNEEDEPHPRFLHPKVTLDKMKLFIDHIQVELKNMQASLRKPSVKNISQNANNKFNKDCEELLEILTSTFDSSFAECRSILRDDVTNLMPLCIRHYRVYTFIGGNPWEFVLRLIDNKIYLKMCKQLTNCFHQKKLNKLLRTPSIGDLIVVANGAKLFRGIYLGIFDFKYRVFDVDLGSFQEMKHKEFYSVPDFVKSVNPQSILCTFEEDFYTKGFWKDQFNDILKQLLQDLNISVIIKAQVAMSAPPKYLVELRHHNKFQSGNVNGYVDNLLKLVVKYRGNVKAVVSKANDLPRPSCDDNIVQTSEVLSNAIATKETSNENNYSLKCTRESTSLGANHVPSEVTPSVELTKASFVKNPENKHKGESVDDSGILPVAFTGSYLRQLIEEEDELAEYLDIVNDPELETDVGAIYNDEVSYCKFFAKDGRCWKSDCTREHIGPVGPGYLGSVYAYGQCAEILDLPAPNEIVELFPRTLLCGHIFYAHLHKEVDECELSLRMIEQRMNNQQEYSRFQLFDLLPAIGELCVVLSKKLGKWCRARVLSMSNGFVKVFHFDYGSTENISLRDIRKINLDLLYLPPQAVRCTIMGIKPKLDKAKKALILLSKLILEKVVLATIIDSNPSEALLEVLLLLTDGRNVADMLVKRGFYEHY